jgi:hypothetical protein
MSEILQIMEDLFLYMKISLFLNDIVIVLFIEEKYMA